jgi:NitT/TauT family transport system substrate-binding protein
MLRGKAAHGRRWRQVLRRLAFVLALAVVAAPAHAQEPVRIGMGFGLAFLPIFLCEDLKLIEKHGKDAHLNLKATYQRFLGAGPLQDALASGAIDVASFGVAPLLAAWEKGKGSPRQILAVAGMSTLPLTLLTNRAGVRTLADFRPTDRIAVPTASSPQAYLLRMQSEKIFGQYRYASLRSKFRCLTAVRGCPIPCCRRAQSAACLRGT